MTTELQEHEDFNYCFWAKLIVAIPAIPLIALIGAIPFQDPVLQAISAVGLVAFSLWLAFKIDRIPLLLRKVNPK